MYTIYGSASATTGITIDQYIKQDGTKRTREDIDGTNAGRVKENATMIRDVLSTKIRLDFDLRPLPNDIVNQILDIVEEPYCWITYDDPRHGRRTKVKCYSNNNTVTHSTTFPDGTVLWGGVSFFLTEC